ncbi:ERV/ALR sulfhydryl oxidase domain-containing protein [Globomyces pollinis-pini]|nr:ERV/ALR sulfhydryl oxidase domain-containing protein [Globomyces pollinis-pini]
MVEKEEKPCNVCSDFSTLRKKQRKKFKKELNSAAYPPECPPDGPQLGRQTWAFLHTMAAYYPEKPTILDKSTMNSFIGGLARFYPCGYCADHLQTEIKVNPPKLDSNVELSNWFCQVHNEVNVRLGKPTFDCSKVLERWRDGPPDANCFQ